ncbi:zinc finger protein 271-like [Chrysoperla carnea]|uniref:zinc finger protein 271-like n=1 Tax=Chrysoperla carnea TaxID=189513 RepID=UPI001D0716B8|nr:zinc finger protein 271-like [Chrysoperla carnea]
MENEIFEGTVTKIEQVSLKEEIIEEPVEIKHEEIHFNDVFTEYENVKLEQQLNTEPISKNEIFNENVLEHQQTDIEDKRFSCEKSKLIKHQRTHSGTKPLTCDVCDKTFNLQSDLALHKRIHTGEKTYSCEICNKQFSDRSKLKHQRTHTGKKPLTCEVCDKTFNLQKQTETVRLENGGIKEEIPMETVKIEHR